MNDIEIDFETINDELSNVTTLTVQDAELIFTRTINLAPFIEIAESFEVVDRESASQCLSMSLQARKMRQALDKKRAEITRPAYDFQKSINVLAKSFEVKLQAMEDSLSDKVKAWMKEVPEEQAIALLNNSIEVADGSISKKLKWVFSIENESEIPREFLSVDEKKINFAIKSGIRNIKGIKVYEDIQIDMRVKN